MILFVIDIHIIIQSNAGEHFDSSIITFVIMKITDLKKNNNSDQFENMK